MKKKFMLQKLTVGVLAMLIAAPIFAEPVCVEAAKAKESVDSEFPSSGNWEKQNQKMRAKSIKKSQAKQQKVDAKSQARMQKAAAEAQARRAKAAEEARIRQEKAAAKEQAEAEKAARQAVKDQERAEKEALQEQAREAKEALREQARAEKEAKKAAKSGKTVKPVENTNTAPVATEEVASNNTSAPVEEIVDEGPV
ncbi:MAG: hypothetical protein MJ055_04020, partial [Phascolarctobacterium sp.]|nr:hypothetical protein [Phascolarctobacterium sp.]